MLVLIGLGLWDEADMSLRALEYCKKCDFVCVEFYTSNWQGNIKNLEKIIGKKITALKRQDLEEKSEELIEKAKASNVALLVPGDPLAATTHVDLLLQARKQKIKTKVVHNASIFSAIGEAGLQLYKFGKTTSIPRITKEYNPESFYDAIKLNKENGLHTLLLLDTEEKPMNISEAIQILLDTEKRRKERVFTEETEMIVFAGAGSDSPEIRFGKIKDIKDKKFKMPACLIIPGKLHFKEKEFLEEFG